MLSLLTTDFSYNNFTGPIPIELAAFLNTSTFAGNSLLCGNLTCLPSCSNSGIGTRKTSNHKKLFIAIVIAIAVLFLLAIAVTMLILVYCKNREKETSTMGSIRAKNGAELSLIWERIGKFSFYELMKDTDNFVDVYIIGEGTFERVYKADLPFG
ncbi:putative LRR receptor-like serine/threonine-protein kinase [Dendrobium catenatum]|uniref:non-specific serine/threonine protein kinase n=1 Tax=Dendrobium catenatum TaxID=906689 RepID=A0A2I0WIA4_9ASPA|nr:putative LRR receptor-like serine/threonine-protein kinase [Dendrobium catenatum]